MTELYIVRHGQTAWSKVGQYTSVSDLDLTPDGVQEAQLLREKLDPADFGLVLTSPRLRARRTAELAGFTDAEVCEDLAEWTYGDFEGLTIDQIHEQAPDWRIWDDDPRGGETWEQVTARLARVASRVRGSGAERAIVFSHGHASRVLALVWLGWPRTQGAQIPLRTASLSVLGREKESPAILRWNA